MEGVAIAVASGFPRAAVASSPAIAATGAKFRYGDRSG
jgi:hypothetical protein